MNVSLHGLLPSPTEQRLLHSSFSQHCAVNENQHRHNSAQDQDESFTSCVISHEQISNVGAEYLSTIQSPVLTYENGDKDRRDKTREKWVSGKRTNIKIKEDLIREWKKKRRQEDGTGRARVWLEATQGNLLKTVTCQQVKGNIPVPDYVNMKLPEEASRAVIQQSLT